MIIFQLHRLIIYPEQYLLVEVHKTARENQKKLFFLLLVTSHIDDSGHRIPLDSAGKMRESHRILQENTGNRWNMEAVF